MTLTFKPSKACGSNAHDECSGKTLADGSRTPNLLPCSCSCRVPGWPGSVNQSVPGPRKTLVALLAEETSGKRNDMA
jgi:hypothetical protein